MKIRSSTKKDLPFLKKMLFEAFFWNPSLSSPEYQDFFKHPEFSKLMSKWGRPDDRAVIAVENDKPIGAAWYRFWTDENHSYGFVDSETPELGIGVVDSFRSKGVGRDLLRELIEVARTEGITMSLSVDPANYACKLYGSEGFVKVGESGTSWTLLIYL